MPHAQPLVLAVVPFPIVRTRQSSTAPWLIRPPADEHATETLLAACRTHASGIAATTLRVSSICSESHAVAGEWPFER
eukprot:1597831-Pleurochrysis_carterae.AAC.1